MVISDVLLVYPGEDRGIRSAIVFFLKPVFAMLFDRCSQSIFGWLCIRDTSLYLMISVEPIQDFLKEGVFHIWFKMKITLTK